MRALAASTILTIGIVLAAGDARAQIYGPRFPVSPAPYENVPDSYCLQGRDWGYPGNCQYSSYAQCMASARGTFSYCGVNPHYAFARQRRGDYQPGY